MASLKDWRIDMEKMDGEKIISIISALDELRDWEMFYGQFRDTRIFDLKRDLEESLKRKGGYGTQEIECPECGHDEVNTAIWGGGVTRDGINIRAVDINIDDDCEDARCTACGYEAHYLDFLIKT